MAANSGVTNIAKMSAYTLDPVGFIRSTVKGPEDAPRQGPEGSPEFSVVRIGADQGS